MEKVKSKAMTFMYVLLIIIILFVIIGGCRYILFKKEMEKIEVAQTISQNLVENVKKTGKITIEDYNKLIETLNATGYTYNLELTVKLSGKQPLKMINNISESQFYDKYTSEIIECLNNEGVYYFNVGEIVTLTIKSPKNEVGGQYSSIVTVNGNPEL